MTKKRSRIGQRRKKTKRSRVVRPTDTRHGATHTVHQGKRVCTTREKYNNNEADHSAFPQMPSVGFYRKVVRVRGEGSHFTPTQCEFMQTIFLIGMDKAKR